MNPWHSRTLTPIPTPLPMEEAEPAAELDQYELDLASYQLLDIIVLGARLEFLELLDSPECATRPADERYDLRRRSDLLGSVAETLFTRKPFVLQRDEWVVLMDALCDRAEVLQATIENSRRGLRAAWARTRAARRLKPIHELIAYFDA